MREELHTAESVPSAAEQYEALIAAIPGGIVITEADPSFTMLFANQGYYDMVGYTREAHVQRFHNVGAATLHPDEAQSALASAREQMAQSGTFSVKARVSHQEKGYIWVHFSGRLRTGPDGKARIYVVLVDLSEHLQTLEQLEQEKNFNELISTLSEESFFDCDLRAGTLRHSKNFAQTLGLDQSPADHMSVFRRLGLLGEGSALRSEEALLSMLAETPEHEVQLTQPDGGAVWYLCRCAVLRDAAGAPYRVVGKLSDITRHKLQIDELSHLAERDQLTGLFNKAATERQIKDLLNLRRIHDDNYAWMIIDIDNFKTVNDRLGHLYGDVVLTQLAEQLRSLFRSDDIVGRVGGDEFFVFLKHYRSAAILREKAEEICALFHKTYSEGDAFVTISASIGIALCPEHGTDFDVLYQKADAALYEVKASGKNAVSFYTDHLTHAYTSQRTEIDLSTLTKSFKDNRIEYVFRLLYDSGNPASSIQAVLQLVTESYGFSRGYIFETSADGRFTSNTFEWCAKGIRAEIQNLQNVPIEAVATANSRFIETGMFLLKSIHTLPDIERAVLEPQGILSMFQFGIMDMGRLVGFIGFDDCISERIPTDPEIDEICTVCHVLATFLLKHRGSEREIRRHEAVELVMDHMGCLAYVIEPEAHVVLYENQALVRSMGRSSLRQTCFEAYRGACTPCPDCPAARLPEGGNRQTALLPSGKSGRSLYLEASRLCWSDGRPAVLLCGVDLPPPAGRGRRSLPRGEHTP